MIPYLLGSGGCWKNELYVFPTYLALEAAGTMSFAAENLCLMAGLETEQLVAAQGDSEDATETGGTVQHGHQ